MGGGVAWTDFTAGLQAMEQARVADLVRYVGRMLDQDRGLREMPFRLAWPILLGGYAEMAVTVPEDVPFR